MKSNKSKNVFHEIALLAVSNFFPVQKLFLATFEFSKNGIWPKIKFREIDLFDFKRFFGLDFLNIMAHCVIM